MARFISKCKNLSVTLTPTNRVVDSSGVVKKSPGNRVQFENGVFNTEKESTIELMRGNYAFGKAYYEVGDDKLSDDIIKRLASRPIKVVEGTRGTTVKSGLIKEEGAGEDL